MLNRLVFVRLYNHLLKGNLEQVPKLFHIIQDQYPLHSKISTDLHALNNDIYQYLEDIRTTTGAPEALQQEREVLLTEGMQLLELLKSSLNASET